MNSTTVDLMDVLREAPERSRSQRLAALEEANRIRSHRAELKRKLRAGELDPAEVLADPDCATMKVSKLLVALPKVGRVKAERALRRTNTSPSRTLGGLTPRQRAELLDLLPRS